MQQEDKKMLITDFNLIKVIGKGSYAKVLLVRKIDDEKIYAIKALKKKYIDQKRQSEHIMVERNVLVSVNHPFIIKLAYTFQNERKLYFVLEFCPGGELFYLLQKKKKLTEEQYNIIQTRTRFYAAQMVLAIQHLHQNNIIYRDLKPENVLLDKDGYLRLADFGLSRRNVLTDSDAKSVCGTPEYLAPEIILKVGHGKPVDWWTLGCIIYEMVTGNPPYYGKSRQELFDKIKFNVPKYPQNFSPELRNLFEGLFQKDPQDRLGTERDIIEHPWFQGVNWDAILNKTVVPPFKPQVNSDISTQNFDPEFTSEPTESYDPAVISLQRSYPGFTYDEQIQIE